MSNMILLLYFDFGQTTRTRPSGNIVRSFKPIEVYFLRSTETHLLTVILRTTAPRKTNLEEVPPLVSDFKFYNVYDNLSFMLFSIVLDVNALIYFCLVKKMCYCTMTMSSVAVYCSNFHCFSS